MTDTNSPKLTDDQIAQMVRDEFARPASYTDKDAYDFFAGQPEPVKTDRGFDILSTVLVIMYLVSLVCFIGSILAVMASVWVALWLMWGGFTFTTTATVTAALYKI
jgi:fatty acid desaturase